MKTPRRTLEPGRLRPTFAAAAAILTRCALSQNSFAKQPANKKPAADRKEAVVLVGGEERRGEEGKNSISHKRRISERAGVGKLVGGGVGGRSPGIKREILLPRDCGRGLGGGRVQQQ